MNVVAKFQIGKSGVTLGAITALNSHLLKHKHVRVSVLKSSRRDRSSIKEIADQIVAGVNVSCTYNIIGFTIILRKHASKSKELT